MKTKHLLLALAFTALSGFVKSQTKYEFMIMEYSTLDNKVSCSIDGKDFFKEKIDFDKHEKSGYNANPLLEKVKEYQDKDWEVMSFDAQIGGTSSINGSNNSSEFYFCYLRRKK